MSPADEAEALQMIKQTLGFQVLVAKLTEMHESNTAPLSISGENWALRSAKRDGKAELAKELIEWVAGRVANVDPNSPTEA